MDDYYVNFCSVNGAKLRAREPDLSLDTGVFPGSSSSGGVVLFSFYLCEKVVKTCYSALEQAIIYISYVPTETQSLQSHMKRKHRSDSRSLETSLLSTFLTSLAQAFCSVHDTGSLT